MFTDVTDLCDSEAEDGDLDLESTAFSDNTDFAERTLRTQGDVPQALGTVVQYVKATCGDDYKANVTSSWEYRVSAPPGVGGGGCGRF